MRWHRTICFNSCSLWCADLPLKQPTHTSLAVPCTRHCNPSLQARLETAQAQTAAAKHEAELALREKDTMLQHQMTEAAEAATAAEQGAAKDIAKIEQLLAESRVTVQWLEIEVCPISLTLIASNKTIFIGNPDNVITFKSDLLCAG